MSDSPIADYALLSDCQGAALVSRAGSVDWLCLPRFDTRSVFARLLGEQAGHWSITPTTAFESTRRYLDQTMVLETTFTSGDATVRLTDVLAVDANPDGHQLGHDAPHTLLRGVECVAGEMELAVEYVPRPEYGLVKPVLREVEGCLVNRGSPDRFALTTPVRLDIDDGGAAARFRLRAGQRLGFALQYAPLTGRPRAWAQRQIWRGLARSGRGWRTWAKLHQAYEGPWRELVHASGRFLQALTFQPTGAVVAAPTTSLPEQIGGERNFDYRYAWVRDASFTLNALWVAACPHEAAAFFGWMVDAAAAQVAQGEPLQIMFGVRGEHDLAERVLAHLPGWRGSRPVRVGNAAWRQHQLDVNGELLDATHRLRDVLGDLDEDTRRFLRAVADGVAGHWREPDQGIWEVRGEPRHFVYSKLMCWVALDRAIALAPVLGAEDAVERWTGVREEIRAAIEEHGWSETAQAYVQAFGSDTLDASVLMMPIVGYTPADSPRMHATIDAIQQRLTAPSGLVFRYLRADDGFTGAEGTFLMCTFWLAHCLAGAGRRDEADEVFERAAAYANDVGLLAEQVDPETGELLGNFPQAFSHIGLINAAWAISQARNGVAR